MIMWLWRIIWGRPTCEHKWEVKETATVSCDGKAKEKVYLLSCSRCGDLKNHSFASNIYV